MGNFRAMTWEEAQRMMRLAEIEYRPKEIVELKARIEGETRAAELRASVTREIDEEKVREIVRMQFELDGLYSRWVAGEIS